MKRNLQRVCLFIGYLLVYAAASGQNDTATWALTANQSASTAGNITATAQSLTGLAVNNYLSGNGGQRVKTPTGDWPAETGPNSGRYLQYTITPGGTDNLLINQVSLGLSFNSSGVVHASIAWSVDGTSFTNIVNDLNLVSGATPAISTYSGLSLMVLSGQTFYLRVSPWSTGAQAATKYLVSKNVVITGAVTAATSATWALTADQGVSAGTGLTGSPQSLTGLTVNNYISSNGGQRVKTVAGDWPAETGPNSSRYVQYALMPAAGKDMTVTQVSVPLSFNSSAYVHACISYSTNGVDFTNLIADTALPSGTTPAVIDIGGLGIFVADGQTFYLRVSPWSTGVQAPTKYLVSKNVVITAVTQPVLQFAFPGAEGGGRYAKGGRGGSVYYVTTLADSGPGSLRDAVSQDNRTIMFKVSGTIHLASTLTINRNYLTIAGQTAPGDGICVANYGVGIRGSHIILRYMRFRLGDVDSVSTDALYGGSTSSGPSDVRDIIIDHCSLSWSVDETGSFYAIANFTLQWCILSESLYHSFHPNDDTSIHNTVNHGYGGIWGGQNASFHHNLLAHHTSRNPRFSGSANTQRPDLEYVDYRNNVVYNWGNINSSYGGNGGHHNMVNNYYKPGPATPGNNSSGRTNKRNRILQYTSFVISAITGDTIWGGEFYINGNHVEGYSDVTADNWTNGVQPDSYAAADSMIALGKHTTPFPYAPVNTQPAEDAYVSVTDSAGAILPRRDTIDRRVISETKTGTAHFEGAGYSTVTGTNISHPAGIIDSQTDAGGWPTLTGTTYPNDTDGDGLPDWWEKKTGGSDADSTSTGPNTNGTGGYTLLENYLNAIESPDKQVTFTTASGSLAGTDTVNLAFAIGWAKDLYTFGLFRSSDNVNFTLIDTVLSGINKIKYGFHDYAAPHSQLYYKIGSYRTRQRMDTVYSNTVSISNEGSMRRIVSVPADTTAKAGDLLKISPNPASGLLIVQHPRANAGAVISIYTTGGQLLGSYKPSAGQTKTSIDVSHFSSGPYVLMLYNITSAGTVVFVRQ